MLTIWCSASIQRTYLSPTYRKKWEDLLQPKWKGNKLALDRDNAVWYSGLALYWGKEKADKFMKALADQNPTMRKGHTLIATLLSSGEFPLGLVYAHRVEEMKAKGISTIEWHPLEPIVATPNVIGIGKNAPNPSAAKLFVDFFLSKEGQTISQKQQYRCLQTRIYRLFHRTWIPRISRFLW